MTAKFTIFLRMNIFLAMDLFAFSESLLKVNQVLTYVLVIILTSESVCVYIYIYIGMGKKDHEILLGMAYENCWNNSQKLVKIFFLSPKRLLG